ncbi:CapA family protein [Paracoccaceae bacterium GXU_MW_L88]
MKIRKLTSLAAGNPWSRSPVIVADLPKSAAVSPEEIRTLYKAIGPQRASITDFPGWAQIGGARSAVPAAHVVEVLAIFFQRALHWPVSACAFVPKGPAIFETRNPRIGRNAARAGAELLTALQAGGTEKDLRKSVSEILTAFLKREAKRTPASDALELADRAAKRGIPWNSVPESTFVRLGSGQYSKVLRGTESSDTSLIGQRLAKKKTVTNAMLAEANIPVPQQRTVRSIRQAVEAYNALGRNVVVKPVDGNQGKGITVRPGSALQAARAFRYARKVSRIVLVESCIEGDEYRLLVIGGEIRAASLRRPARVVGNGKSTIRQLVAKVNKDPLRAPVPHGRLAMRLPIKLDAAAKTHLKGQGLSPDSVPKKGKIIQINGVSNVSMGGDTVDVTDKVHPEVREMAERTAQILNIDMCGIDYLTTDISKSPEATNGAICEANTQPGMSLHLIVAESEPRDVAADYVNVLFPEGAQSHTPVIAVAKGTDSASVVKNMIAATRTTGAKLGVYSQNEAVLKGADHVIALPSPDAVLWEQRIDAAVVEVSDEGIIRNGLGLERVDLAVLPNEPIHEAAIMTLQQVSNSQILAAADPDLMPRALAAMALIAPDETASPVARSRDQVAESLDAKLREQSFTATFVGDIGFGEAYRHYPKCRDLQRLLDQGYGQCLSHVQHLLEPADMLIGNLEVPLAPRIDERLRGRKKFLGWCDPARTVSALRGAGFTALSLANNHALDCGGFGLSATQDQLTRARIVPFGAGPNISLAERPIVKTLTVGGRERSLVIFAGFEHRNRYDRRYRWYASPETEGVARLDPERIGQMIRYLRAELADPIFVAYPHWGTDYQDVTERQRELAWGLIDAGIDVIIGHGTHSSQRIEMLNGKPVLFGIGNFVWNTPGSGFHKFDAPPFGLVTELMIGARGAPKLRVYPIVTDNSVTNFRNRPVTPDEFDTAVAALLPDQGQAQHRGREGRLFFELAADAPWSGAKAGARAKERVQEYRI